MSQFEAPPHYDSVDLQNHKSSVDIPRGQIFEENEYGEMEPSSTSQPPRDIHGNPIQMGQLPPGTAFSEDEYGEIREADVNTSAQDPHKKFVPEDSTRSTDFGENTGARSEAFRSSEVYPENRFGELGRADTMYEDQNVGTADKVKGG